MSNWAPSILGQPGPYWGETSFLLVRRGFEQAGGLATHANYDNLSLLDVPNPDGQDIIVRLPHMAPVVVEGRNSRFARPGGDESERDVLVGPPIGTVEPVVKLPPASPVSGCEYRRAVRWSPGRVVLRNYVEREVLEIPVVGMPAPGEERKLSWLEKGFKKLHLRQGLFPSGEKCSSTCKSVPLPTLQSNGDAGVVYCRAVSDDATTSLSKLLDGKMPHGVRNAPEDSGESRIRKRAVWVNRLGGELGLAPGLLSAFLKGRWTPDLTFKDLPVGARFLASQFDCGSKYLGGGIAKTRPLSKDELEEGVSVQRTPFLRLGMDGREVVVFPELVARLTTYAFLRPRDSALVAGLKARAQEWCKTRYLTDAEVAGKLPLSVALSVFRSSQETDAERVLMLGTEVADRGSDRQGGNWWNTRL